MVGGKSASKRELVVEAWKAGELAWKLHRGQLDLYHASMAMPPNSMLVEVCARRFGKTFEMMVQIEEFARRNPDSIQLFAAPTKAAAADIVIPNWNKILADCPKELRPQYKPGTGVWEYPNNAVLKLRGTDLEVDRLRGAGADHIHIDEAGFHKNLRRTVIDILAPQTDTTGGKMTMSTTPPNSMDHDFTEFWNEAKLQTGELDRAMGLITKTVFDNPMLSASTLFRICRRANGGMDRDYVKRLIAREKGLKGTPTWEREYLCQMVTDMTRRVTPEFDPERHVRGDYLKPHYYDPYVFIDLAFVKDYTHALFAFFDFEKSILVVEDEWRGRRLSSPEIHAELAKKEKEHFGKRYPLRYGDNSNQQQLWDLQRLHNYVVLPTKKDLKEAMVNQLRALFQANKVIIHPRCKFLIDQLENGLWKDDTEGKPAFERTEKMGHLDAIDALVYGIRNVDWTRNPAPAGIVNRYTHMITMPDYAKPQQTIELSKLMRGVYGRNQ
jgi:hypothetical protein